MYVLQATLLLCLINVLQGTHYRFSGIVCEHWSMHSQLGPRVQLHIVGANC